VGPLDYALVDADALAAVDLADYPGLRVWVQPGGNAYEQQLSIGAAGKRQLLDFIGRAGTLYVGTCAGWFFASEGYVWQGEPYSWPHALKLFPTTEGSLTEIADYDGDPGYGLTALSGPAAGGGPGRVALNAVYYGGPTRGWRDTPRDCPGTELLGYDALAGALPAVVECEAGGGRLLLYSAHLEAGLDEGVPAFFPPHSILDGESLYMQHIPVTNDSAPSFTHRPTRASGSRGACSAAPTARPTTATGPR
jgi:glutamine amidotransferase-like uncharacterized protein